MGGPEKKIQFLLAPAPHFPNLVAVGVGECVRLTVDNVAPDRLPSLDVGDVRGMAGAATPIEVHDGRVVEYDLTSRPYPDSGGHQVVSISAALALARRVLDVVEQHEQHEPGDDLDLRIERLAQEAELEEDGVGVCDAGDWLSYVPADDMPEFVAMSDDALIRRAADDEIILLDVESWREEIARDHPETVKAPIRRRSGMRP